LAYTDNQGQQRERLDWALLKNGPIALYFRREILAEALEWFRLNQYTIAEVDCRACDSKAELLKTIGRVLGFPAWPSPNLDGFNDDFSELVVPEVGGFILVLSGFDHAARKLPDESLHMLDIIALASRDQILFGKRFLCLVQSDDPEISFGLVGGAAPMWNPREWLNKNRGV
jgi:Barstar (barnase inhibitor)